MRTGLTAVVDTEAGDEALQNGLARLPADVNPAGAGA